MGGKPPNRANISNVTSGLTHVWYASAPPHGPGWWEHAGRLLLRWTSWAGLTQGRRLVAELMFIFHVAHPSCLQCRGDQDAGSAMPVIRREQQDGPRMHHAFLEGFWRDLEGLPPIVIVLRRSGYPTSCIIGQGSCSLLSQDPPAFCAELRCTVKAHE